MTQKCNVMNLRNAWKLLCVLCGIIQPSIHILAWWNRFSHFCSLFGHIKYIPPTWPCHGVMPSLMTTLNLVYRLLCG